MKSCAGSDENAHCDTFLNHTLKMNSDHENQRIGVHVMYFRECPSMRNLPKKRK